MSQIGQYEIIEKIGSGGMASVFKAYQPKLDRHVAIKMIHKNFSQDAQFNSRFEREARIVASLDHPHIVPIYDYDEYDEQSYLVMKYVEGITLKDVLRKEILTPQTALNLIDPIARALHHAHNQGVLHRDIKPSNILIDQRGTTHLTDFGLARVVQQGESSMSLDMVLGTPHYMSPEQAEGQIELDARTDVYSLGVVLYEMLTGRTPFNGETSHTIIHNHIYTPPPPPREINPDIPEGIEDVILKALEKNPGNRYKTAIELIEDYRQNMAQNMVASAPARPHEQMRPTGASTPAEENLTTIQPRPEGTFQRFVHGMETFGTEVEQAFRDFDKNEHGTEGAKNRLKHAIQKGIEASGFSDELKSQVKNIAEKNVHSRKFKFNLDFLNGGKTANLSEEERIRKEVEERIKKQQEEFQGLIIHAMIYFFINMFILHWMPWVAIPWGIGLVGHAFSYYNEHSGAQQRRIEREVEREKERLGYSKVKNDAHNQADYIRLTEDGEFTESFVEEQQDKYKRK